MKIHLRLFAVFVSIFLLISCSKDNVDKHNDLLGVWERTELNTDFTNTFTLVFGSNNTGLKIYKNVTSDGETSSANSFNWKAIGKKVTLLENNSEETYIISNEGELVLSTSNDFFLIKVSDDYSSYY